MEFLYAVLYLAGLAFFALGLRFLPWSATARRGNALLGIGALLFATIIGASLFDDDGNQAVLQFMAGLTIAVLLIIMAHWRFAKSRNAMPHGNTARPHRRSTVPASLR